MSARSGATKVQPRRDAPARRDNVAKLTAKGLGVRAEVGQRLTSPG